MTETIVISVNDLPIKITLNITVESSNNNTGQSGSGTGTPVATDVVLTVAPTSYMTSNFNSAVTHAENTDLRYGDAAAITRAKTSLAPALRFHRQSLLSYGVSDPWEWNGTGTRPAEPTNWASLDYMLHMILEMGGEIILATYNYPWHLRGIWDGVKTVPMTYAQNYDDTGRILTDKVADFLLLIQRTAERYLVAPYNVRYWQTGYEFHGFQRDRKGGFTDLGYDNYPGTPGQADMGMAYLHNIVVAKIIEVAGKLNPPIPRSALKFITNYPEVITNGVAVGGSFSVGHPLRDRPWGTAQKAGPTALVKMLPLLTEWDYWSYDLGSLNKDGVQCVDDWLNQTRYTEIGQYMKDQVALIDPTKLGIVSEYYDKPAVDPGPNAVEHRAAMIADGFKRFTELGLFSAITWSTAGHANAPGVDGEAALVTPPKTANDGQAMPVLGVQKIFHQNFAMGTPLYRVTVQGTGVNAIASDKKIYMVNESAVTKTVRIGQAIYTLAKDQRMLVDR